MQVVTHNLSAMNASRQLNIVTKNVCQLNYESKLRKGYHNGFVMICMTMSSIILCLKNNNSHHHMGFPGGSVVKTLPASAGMQETWV